MKEKIIQYLNQVAAEKNVEILLACETGSRAWGFPSPDSDYDVRFIYKHERNWYLSLDERKDTIERMFENNEFDLSGWDLKKSLNLLWKSNSSLLERIQSPIIYISDNDFLSEINELANSTYSKIATMHHYLNMSKKIYSDIKDKETVKLKKLFYALRTATACKWIEEKEEIPPIVFQTMLDQLDLNHQLKQQILDLIDLKATKNEDYHHTQENEVNLFIENCINKAEKVANSLPGSKGNIETLNAFFIRAFSGFSA
jgi:predicted nucleotidyltransferase